MIIQWNATIPELSGDDERRVYVYLPENYDISGIKYPVMYMTDGQNVFFDSHATYGKSWGMKEYMEINNKQLIIVAVACNFEGNKRLEEYSPVNFSCEPFGDIAGRGAEYMNWLVNVLKPYIDQNYRTISDPDHTIICGSSMGGLMALYGVTVFNHIFHKAACLSPSLWINPREVLEFVRKSSINADTIVYMDYGSEELKNHSENPKVLYDVSNVLLDKGVNPLMRIVDGGTHCEASWEKQIPVFMNYLGL